MKYTKTKRKEIDDLVAKYASQLITTKRTPYISEIHQALKEYHGIEESVSNIRYRKENTGVKDKFEVGKLKSITCNIKAN